MANRYKYVFGSILLKTNKYSPQKTHSEKVRKFGVSGELQLTVCPKASFLPVCKITSLVAVSFSFNMVTYQQIITDIGFSICSKLRSISGMKQHFQLTNGSTGNAMSLKLSL